MKPSKEARQEDIFIVNTGLSTCSCKIRAKRIANEPTILDDSSLYEKCKDMALQLMEEERANTLKVIY